MSESNKPPRSATNEGCVFAVGVTALWIFGLALIVKVLFLS